MRYIVSRVTVEGDELEAESEELAKHYASKKDNWGMSLIPKTVMYYARPLGDALELIRKGGEDE